MKKKKKHKDRCEFIHKSISEVGAEQCRCYLVDVEADVEEVDFILLPAVLLQQLHQHGALFSFLLLFLSYLLLLWGLLLLLLLLLLLIICIIVIIVILCLILLCENQLELRILPERL